MKTRQPLHTRWTAIGLLTHYTSGRRDFRYADLRGVALVGVDLSGIDLQGADLRGADLRGSRLCGANLADAQLGVTKMWLVLRGFFWLLVGLLTLLFVSQLLTLCLSQFDKEFSIQGTPIMLLAGKLRFPTLFVFSAFIVSSITIFGRETIVGIRKILYAIIFASLLLALLGLIFSLITFMLLAFMFVVSVAGKEKTAESLEESLGYIFLGFPLITAFVIGFIRLRLHQQALQRDPRLSKLRDWILWFTCLKGTDLRGADLTDADLTRARLGGSDFRDARILRTRFVEAMGIEKVQTSGTDVDVHR